MDLLELRDQIDVIDKEIVRLYEERMDICKKVAEYKIENGKQVFDKEREKEKIKKVKSLTHNDFNSMEYDEDEFDHVISMIKRGVLKELESEKDA